MYISIFEFHANYIIFVEMNQIKSAWMYSRKLGNSNVIELEILFVSLGNA